MAFIILTIIVVFAFPLVVEVDRKGKDNLVTRVAEEAVASPAYILFSSLFGTFFGASRKLAYGIVIIVGALVALTAAYYGLMILSWLIRQIIGGRVMPIIGWPVIGMIAAFFANRTVNVKPGKVPMLKVLLGIVGAEIGGFIFIAFGGASSFSIYSVLAAGIGAAGILFINRVVTRGSSVN